jgi:regulator of protease activity HflC (stomatin/prohibitin superfamily)
MRTQQLDMPRQTVITRDDVPVTADTEIFIKVMDAKKSFLEVDDYKQSVTNLVQTTVREVLNDMDSGDVNIDDIDYDERQTVLEKINTRIDNEFEEKYEGNTRKYDTEILMTRIMENRCDND